MRVVRTRSQARSGSGDSSSPPSSPGGAYCDQRTQAGLGSRTSASRGRGEEEVGEVLHHSPASTTPQRHTRAHATCGGRSRQRTRGSSAVSASAPARNRELEIWRYHVVFAPANAVGGNFPGGDDLRLYAQLAAARFPKPPASMLAGIPGTLRCRRFSGRLASRVVLFHFRKDPSNRCYNIEASTTATTSSVRRAGPALLVSLKD